MKSNYLIYNTIQVKSTGTFKDHEEFVNINLISGYKPIALAGWHAETTTKIFLYNLYMGNSTNSYRIGLGWKTFDGSQITNNIVKVTIVYMRSN